MSDRSADPGRGVPTEALDRSASRDAVAGVLRVLESFHERYVEDRAAGRVRSAQDYAALFPGFEDVVREQFRRMRAEDPPVHVPTSPAPTLAHLVGKGLRDTPAMEEIARGGMGAIYRIRDEVLHRDLAMKVILDEKAILHVEGASDGVPTGTASTSLRRMMLEAQITAQLSHPGIVPVHEMGIDRRGRLFFTMKLVHGRTLGEIFRLQRERREGWTLTRALGVFIRICETLAFAHSKGVIHRDLKPPNVMVGTYGEVYVMDWGIAKVLHPQPGSDPLTLASTRAVLDEDSVEPSPLTRMGDIVGTPEYMPPEQALGHLHELDRRTDVYAVGAMLYEMLADRAPYAEPDTPRTPVRILQSVMRGPPAPVESLAPELPAELLAICRKAMARERHDRYQTAEELANDLHRFIEGRVVHAHRTGPLVELRSWIRRNTAVAWTAAVSFALLVAGTVWFGLEQRKAARRVAAERDAARVAESRERAERKRAVGLLLAAKASALAEERPADALQIAVEAAARTPQAESRDALYAALSRHHERRRLLGHDSYVKEGHFSPDGERILTREEGSCAILWSTGEGAVLRRILTPGEDILRTSFSPDGTRIALGLESGVVQMADGVSGAPLFRLEGHAGPVRGLAFSPDGRTLATGGEDGGIRFWSTGGGQAIRDPFAGSVPILDLGFSADGARLAALAEDGSCAVLDAATGRPIPALGIEGRPAPERGAPPDESRLHFLDGGRLLALHWMATELRVFDLAAGRPRPLLRRDDVRSVAASGDGRRLVASISAGGSPPVLERWDVADLTTSRVVPVTRSLDGISLDRSGRRAAGSVNFDAEVWDLDDGERVSLLRGHHYGGIRSEWHPDGERILTVSSDMTARVWMAEPVDAVRLPPGAERDWWSDGGRKHLEIPGPRDGAEVTVEVVESGGGRSRFKVPGPLRSIRWLRDGVHLLEAGDREVRVIRASTGEVRGSAPLPEGVSLEQDRKVSMSADLSRAVMVVEPGVLGIADLATGTWLPHRIPDQIEFSLSPDGRSLLTTEGGEGTATIWDLDTGESRFVLAGHTGYVLSACWSPDGLRVSTGAVEGRIRVWNAATGELVTTPGPVPMGRNLVDLAAGRPWVSASRGGTVCVYDRETAESLFNLREPADVGEIETARFLPGGGEVATDTGDGGLIRRWPLDPLPVARERFPVDLDPIIVRKYGLLPPSEAADYADAWLQRHPSSRGLARRAVLAVRDGDLEGAAVWIERARRLRPDLRHADWAEACLLARRTRDVPEGPERASLRNRALDALARSLERDSEASPALARTESLLAPLRGDPRFRAITGE